MPRGSLFRLIPATLLLTSLVASACGEDSVTGSRTDGRIYGASVTVGSGTARAYVVLNAGKPTEIGVALSEAALTNLPAQGGAGAGDHMNMAMYLLPLPAEASATPFRLVELDWNPVGHEPPGIYDLPHFDFHFYTITQAQRDGIDPADPAYAQKARSMPPAARMPQGYLAGSTLANAPAEAVTVPHMGLHWLDPQSPELHGQTFNHTFIYGSWDGQLIFAEPMITRAFLESKPDFSAAIAQPQQYAAGYFPSGQSIRWDAAAREYRIALTGLVQH